LHGLQQVLAMSSLAWRLYARSLNAYQQASRSGAWWCGLYEAAIRAVVPVLGWMQHVKFPERRTGGWWWIWRYRFEVLMGWYERDSEQCFRERIHPGSTVLDIGAHIGVHTRRFSRLAGVQGRVYAFEASPENVAVLRHNVTSTRFPNVEIVPAAVSDRCGTATLHLSPGHSNHSLNAGYTAETGTVEVPCLSIDAFCADRSISRVDFVKVDTEGAEPLVLRGMADTIRRNSAIQLLIEFNPAALRAGGVEPARFLDFLGTLGLRYTCVGEGEIAAHRHADLLCTRR
jgi:FkbM family methyltransferase